MTSRHSHRSMGELFNFALLAALALLSIALVAAGAGTYRRMADSARGNSDLRTTLSYLCGKVHSGDDAAICEVGGVQVLTLSRQVNGDGYITYIYWHSGALKEYFSPEGQPFDPDYGEVIAEVRALRMEDLGGLYRFTVELSSGGSFEVSASPGTEARE